MKYFSSHTTLHGGGKLLSQDEVNRLSFPGRTGKKKQMFETQQGSRRLDALRRSRGDPQQGKFEIS